MRDLIITQNITVDRVIDNDASWFGPLDAADDYDDVNEALVAQAHASDAFLVGRTLTGDARDCKGWGSACPARDPSRDARRSCWVQEHDR